MNHENMQPVLLKPPISPDNTWFYPWLGGLVGAAVGGFMGSAFPVIMKEFFRAICYRAPFQLKDAFISGFQPDNWLALVAYTLCGVCGGTILGIIIKRLKEHRQRLQTLNHEFELQAATLRHHYKNLAIGIQGFANRIKRKLAKLNEGFSRCIEDHCHIYSELRQDHESINRNLGILEDTAQRLTHTLSQELRFLKALTSRSLNQTPREFYPCFLQALKDLLELRFRDKEVRVEINGQPLDSLQDSLVFAYEPYTMEVILQNILSNSLKYGDYIQVGVRVEGNWIRVEIRDNGPGLDVVRLKEQLLTPGERKEPEASHLGLQVTLHLLEKYGGSLSVWSQPGVGSSFILNFPTQPS
jgi:signal transduction histidine kinase